MVDGAVVASDGSDVGNVGAALGVAVGATVGSLVLVPEHMAYPTWLAFEHCLSSHRNLVGEVARNIMTQSLVESGSPTSHGLTPVGVPSASNP